MSSILDDASNLYVSTDITYNYMTRWAGMGLKNKGGLGIGYQLNFNHGWGRVQVHVKHYQKTFASPAKWSIDPKVSNMCYYNIKFSMATDFFGIFYHMSSFKSINNVFKVVKYHSLPNTLPGYWGANTCTPKSDSSTRSSPNDAFDTDNVNNFKSYTFR